MNEQKRILVIKLSALGDFIQSIGPFAAIRNHHSEAKITLLTTHAFVALAKQSPYFDEIWIDPKCHIWNISNFIKFSKKLRSVAFDMVYDLQTSNRSSSYFRIMKKPPWSGIARNCSHPHANPIRNSIHNIERQAEQLAMANIPITPISDLSWVKADVKRFNLPPRYSLIVPGCSSRRSCKRWQSDRYGEIANYFIKNGIIPVVLGTKNDVDQIQAIINKCPSALSLLNQTSFSDIIVLARNAIVAVGNDTGPMYLISTSGCRSIVLLSNKISDNNFLCTPRGSAIVLKCNNLTDITVTTVISVLKNELSVHYE
ncbi:MAG: glycosyltransferase family 9 protein [Rhodospirillaceae bacterium]|jgi:ADP-heptose:LPS heptosyltransferase|nr:glycosyltransferase family 9 protein [Rhodospirillaceae bacterium]